jgi:trypsin-like peptidase
VSNLATHVHVGSVGMILRAEEGKRQYLGTCFPFRWRHRFLTARHCVDDQQPGDLIVRSQYGRDFRVVAIHRHPDFDIALLEGDPQEGGVPYPFTGLHRFGATSIGLEIVSFGFPVGGTLVEPQEPTPRMFRGYTQRIGEFASADTKPYPAYELSFTAPLGLSGGPVFDISAPDEVFAMVTGVLEAFSILGELTVEKAEGESFARPSHRLIGYGMALSLWHVEQWLKDVAPLAGDSRY